MFLKKLMIFLLSLTVLCQNAYALAPSAKSAVLIEQKSGKVLYEKNAHQKLPMASTTKIMTAICAIENANLDDVVKVDNSAVGVEGSSMYLGYGESITLRNLLYGLMLASGNDAAVAIAMHVGKSVEGFANLMNETAKKIGAVNSSFENPNGLDGENHYTTAYDLALISRYALENEEFANIAKTVQINIPWQGKDYDRTLTNHNKLLKTYEGATGVKTGFTKKSGRCLVSSATRGGLGVVAVTLSDPNDWQDHKSMLDYAFENYEMVNVIKEGEYAGSIDVDFSETKSVSVEFSKDAQILVKKGSSSDYLIKYEMESALNAPVGFGQTVGKAKIISDLATIEEVELVTAGSAKVKESKKLLNEFKNIVIKYIQGV